MSLRADERVEQFERGYQAALRNAIEHIRAVPITWAGDEGTNGFRTVDDYRAEVLAVLERLRG